MHDTLERRVMDRRRSATPGHPIAPSIAAAEDDLVSSLAGVPLTEDQQRIVMWLLTWDQPTLHTIADVIRAARTAGPVQPATRED